MKKQLIALAALFIGLTAAASAFSVASKLQPELSPEFKKGPQATTIINPAQDASFQSRAEGDVVEIDYDLSGGPASALSFNDQTPGMQMAMAFRIDPGFLKTLQNGEITEISYYTGCLYTDESANSIVKANVFIADALDVKGTYLYTQETSAPTTSYTKVSVPLTTPFAIPEGKTSLYIGVNFIINDENCAPIVVDEMNHGTTYGGYVAYRASSLANWQWSNIATSYGFVTLGAKIKGSNMPTNSVSVIAMAGQPVANANEPFGFSFMMQNNGVNEINDLTIQFGIEDEDPYVETLEVQGKWGINQSLVANVEFTAKQPTKSSYITVEVLEINGEPNNAEDNIGMYSVTIVPEDKALPHNVVVEEFTSIKCGWCPRGYTSMELIRENYPDGSIIPVCIHSNGLGPDPMYASTFASLLSKFASGLPASVVNRAYSMDPTYYDLIETAEELLKLPGIAHVEATATLDAETRVITVDTKTQFAFDYTNGNNTFILSYAVTEDNVGPYNQENYYAITGYESLGDWKNQPETVSLMFNDVARQLDKYSGITGSVPANITAGETYEFSHDVKLVSAIKDLSKINLIVYLTNRGTGQIEDACMLRIKENGSFTGIENVVADESDKPVEFYNLQGVRVANPANGIFIRRQGSTVSKVLVK